MPPRACGPIATPTTGLNHIDLACAERRGIHVISLRGETAFLEKIFATGEHTLALILALVRHVPQSAQHVTDGGWNRDLFRGRELHGKTAGIVGLGRVGKMVANYLQASGNEGRRGGPGHERIAHVPVLNSSP